MDLNDKKTMMKLVGDVLACYGKKLPEGGLADAWWNELKAYPMPVISMAFSAYKDENGEFAPVPAGIAKRCRTMDGRPGVEEAWAMIPRDHGGSVVWSNEMAAAWGVAEPLINDGDHIAARMAFKEAYTRMVAQARDQGIAPCWTLSQGDDKTGRQAALTDAVRNHRISVDGALALLPEAAEAMLISLGVKQHPLLAGPTKEGGQQSKALLASLKIKRIE